jgi:peroxiredoxin Q/BCP
MLKENDLAPDFTLTSDQGDEVTLSSFRGKKVVLYFYPKDDTPGCTTEACSFRDDYSQFTMKGAVVIGVSADNETSPKSPGQVRAAVLFAERPEHKVLEAYGAGAKRPPSARPPWHVRTTYVIDEAGAAPTSLPRSAEGTPKRCGLPV